MTQSSFPCTVSNEIRQIIRWWVYINLERVHCGLPESSDEENRRKASSKIASNLAVVWTGKLPKINLQMLSLYCPEKAESCTTWSIHTFQKPILRCHNVSHCTSDYLQLAVIKYNAATVYSFVMGLRSQYFRTWKVSQSQEFRENINLYRLKLWLQKLQLNIANTKPANEQHLDLVLSFSHRHNLFSQDTF